ncbi:MAG: protein translocase subunit SecD [Lachnospiraceae bacterium]
MKKSKSILILVVVLAVLLGAGYYGTRIVRGTAGNEDYKKDGINLGLDLAGGVSITYEVVGDKPTDAEMSDTIYKLQRRVESSSDGSITEPEVYQEGDNRINVDIPGATDEIFKTLQEPGVLEFRGEDGTVILTGKDIKDAQPATIDDMGTKKNIVELTFTKKAGDIFAEYTGSHVNGYMPIYYNDKMISNPQIQGQISGGTAQITGESTFEEAKELASNIRIGTIDLELKQLRANEVSAKLGASAMDTSLKAAGIGLGIVILFMIVMYLIPGLASGIALIIYTALMLIAIKLFGITLTLPGIAGIILSIGMAVDANVIIFARIREEIASGKSVSSAMKIGFQKALSAIVDGNITTLIAAVVLGLLGSGSVKGFAYTLGIGIIISMFTALVVTRFILKAFYAIGIQNPKFYGKQVERTPINFVSKKNIFFICSIAVIAVGFIGMAIHSFKGNDGALNYSLEFMGGTSTTVTFNENYSVEQIESDVIPVISQVTGDKDIQIQKVKGSNQVIVKTRFLQDKERDTLNKTLAEKFSVDENLITFESISSTVSSEMKTDAFEAVIVAMILMLLYIWFRFKDIRFSASAVIALLHDVLVVLAFYALFRVSVGSTFIACMLTIVGYSVNATIVIFDRIRENLGGISQREPEKLKEIVNRSITQTLSRSINTSLTTFIMVAVLFVLGVASIREFALPLMVGIVCGAYSSVCITGSLWYVFKIKFSKKNKSRK